MRPVTLLKACFAAAAASVALGAPAAGDLCRPLAVVQPDDALTLELSSRGSTPKLEATLLRPLVVPGDINAMAREARQGQTTLAQPLIVRYRLGYNDVDTRSAALTVDGEADALLPASAAKRRFLLRFRAGKAVTADGQPLNVLPPLGKETVFAVAGGAAVSAAGADRVRISEGARIVWRPDAKQPLEFSSLVPLRLDETSAASAVQRLTVVRPLRVAPGGTVAVQVSAPGFDFRTKPIAFCFRSQAATGEAPTIASDRVKFVSQTGDVGSFEVGVPPLDAGATGQSQGNWLTGGAQLDAFHRTAGFPVALRAVGFDAGTDVVTVDAADKLTVSSTGAAIILGIAVLAILFFAAALIQGRINPFAAVGSLVRHDTGRYSLSNIQIFLWTVLVIFALTFNWITTGELLDISPGILVLLGISGTASVLVRTIDAKGGAASAASQRSTSLADVCMGDDGEFDLLRFQMLAFTVFTWLYVLVSVLRSQGLPTIPESFYTLMGISNTAYVGGKLPSLVGGKAEPPPGGEDAPTEAERAFTQAELKRLQSRLGVTETGVIDSATREAVRKFKIAGGIAPANGRIDKLLFDAVAAR